MQCGVGVGNQLWCSLLGIQRITRRPRQFSHCVQAGAIFQLHWVELAWTTTIFVQLGWVFLVGLINRPVGGYGFITDFLHFLILCRVDTETAAVNGIVSLCISVAKLIFQILDYLLCKCINKVTVCIISLGRSAGCLDSCIDIIGHRFIILLLADIALLQHIL